MKIGITIGDQSGIGLEIINKATPLFPDVEFKIIGKVIPKELITYGQISSVCGRIAGEAIEEAIKLALHKEIDAIVTAPIHKKALNLGGFPYAGHTEMFAQMTLTDDYAMMLIHENLRVIHVTTHCSLRQALELIKAERIYKKIQVAHNACKQLGIKNPRIAVAALNPHAGDEGLYGDEEEKEIKPAILWARETMQVHPNPIPADVAFAECLGDAFDVVVAMYHDQGHIPVKTVGFRWKEGAWDKIDGVNVTFGLPFIRTSPDHGVAFGKAGKGIADPTSMISAIKIAIKLAEERYVQ